MRTATFVGIFAIALGVGGSQAVAADLVIDEPMVAPAADYDWSGFYLGVHGGWAGAGAEGVFDNGGGPGPWDLADFGPGGGLFGLHAGFQQEFDQFVLGVEGDVSLAFADASETRPVGVGQDYILTTSLDSLASIRGRAGFAPDNFLIYATAGLGYAGFSLSSEANPEGIFLGDGPSGSVSTSGTGIVYGAGVEFAPADSWVIRLEYLHYDVTATYDFVDGEIRDADDGDTVTFGGVDVLRAGLSVSF